MNKFAITALSVLAGMAFTECAAAADASVYDRGAKGDLAAYGGATRIKGDMAAMYAEQIKLASEKHAKNVILFIGDGMGDSEITAARNFAEGAGGYFKGLDALPITGQYTHYSLDKKTRLPNYVTDSAASASEWATGVKTYNGAIGVDLDGKPHENLLELAKKKGLATGNVTTAEIQDATPAALLAHVTARKCYGPKATAEKCPTDLLEKGGLGSITEQLISIGTPSGSLENCPDMKERVVRLIALLRSANEVHQTQEERTAVAARRLNRKENLALLTEEAEKADGRLRELAALREQAQSDTGSIEEKVAAAEQDLVQAQEAERAALDKESADETALEDYKAQVLQAINRISDVRNDQTRLNTMRDTMTSRLKEITVSREKMQAVADDLQAAIDSADDKLRQEQQALDACRREEQERQEAFNASDARLIGLRASAEKLSAQLQSDQSRWKLLDEMTREMEGYSQSVRRAIQFARERHLDGVHGVLAQLLSVPGRYETAIDMALGAAQQNIVTDNEEVAKRLIDYLRQGRFGRATFLPISAIRAKGLNSRERLVLSMPGCLGVASELIGCDDRYRAIVENLLGRTVIADSLENGIPIMRAGSHAFRLVTLEGDVMHSGGSMTGGSTQSRAVNLLGRERELKELTDRLKAGKEDMERMRASLTQEQDRKARLREAVQQALQARHDQEIAVARETEHAAVAREDARQHAERMEETEQAILQLQTAIDEIEKQLRDIQSSGDTAQLDRSAAEARIDEMQEGLTRSRSLAREAQELVVRKTLALNDLRRDAETARRDTARYEADRRLLEEEILQRRSRMRHMAEEEDADAAREAELTALLDARQLTQRQAEEQVQSLEEKRAAERGRLNDLLRQMEELHVSITRDSERLHRVELQMSRVESDLQTLQDRIWNTYGLTYAGAEEFRVPAEHFKEKEADRRVGEINAAIRALGPVNVHAVEEYASTKERYDELKRQQEDLRKAEADLRELIERLLKQMRVTFVDSFSKLQVYFSETFTRLFGGGKAELQLLDPDDPLNCGIEVNAQPPGKKLQLLSLLSGGERALTAIAILFAMLKLKPTPFCILDEIEAALDDANIGYYADYLREYSENTQFIVITHRKGTMERCNALYGVAMEEQGVSKLVSVSLKDYED